MNRNATGDIGPMPRYPPSAQHLTNSRRLLVPFGMDALLVVLCFYVALFFRFRAIPSAQMVMYFEPLTRYVVPIALLFAAVNLLARLDEQIWRYASVQEVLSLWATTTACTLLTILADLGIGEIRARPLPLSVVLLGGFFTFIAFVAVRYRGRLVSGAIWRLNAPQGKFPSPRVRTLIYGAGETGQLLARHLRVENGAESYDILGFVDDDPLKQGLRIHGIKVLGARQSIIELVEQERIELIVLAMPSVRGTVLREVIARCQLTRARIQVAPDTLGFVSGTNREPLLREVGVEDLLGRSSVQTGFAGACDVVQGKVVLVTGACGSIGAELCRQIAAFTPRQILLFDNNETGAYDLEIELHTRFPSLDVTPIVADVTDACKVEYVFRERLPQLVFHVAAYKHVPLMERYPEEAVRVNVGGTRAVVEMARRYGAERFVLVSTDKAVNPSSVMGATKRVAELLVVNAAHSPGQEQRHADGPTLCTAVRFGNVLGSRGSVIPTFARQIELGGPVTVTDRDMTRYFMEIPEAANLIIQAASMTVGGDIFILDMGEPIRVDDLARKMVRMRGLRPDVDIPIVYTGMRAGEKLHEELAYADEVKQATVHPLISRHYGHQGGDATLINDAVDSLLGMLDPARRAQLIAALFTLARTDTPSWRATKQESGVHFPASSR